MKVKLNTNIFIIALLLIPFMFHLNVYSYTKKEKSKVSVNYSIKKFNNTNKISINHLKESVVFYPQHQDDEVLWAGSAIVNAIDKCGADHVYIVLVSDGSGANILKLNPAFLGLNRRQKQYLRDNEFKSALKSLGVKTENIIILPNEASKEGTHYELMKKTILDFEHKFKGNVTHIAHHYRYDDHIMHRMNGQVLKGLADKKQVKHAMYFIKPWYSEKILEKDKINFVVNNDKEYNILKNSCMQYKRVDKKHNRYGIGYKSAPNYFKNLLKDPKFKSIIIIN
ncbi:PIG-L family deacetylase [Clostridioides mangenotii]|uniref:PIG-L family deacetylase n=1 Tax=Metaclostridioides mangenotii TaxID=1540 RepID=UPI001C0FE863|nr:PIG-L family deacetylase [Clostridioides mangenotii]MBU5306180.1 PIG-L family deacetylase [Clostridioides mangenotii]